MIDDNSIKSITSNGGWCEINSQTNQALVEQLGGRIIFNSTDYLVVQRFNLELTILDGYYLFPKLSIKKLKSGNWIKKYLSVGGRVIENIESPKEFTVGNWFDLLTGLRASSELIKFKLASEEILGYINSQTSSQLKVLQVSMKTKAKEISIAVDELVFLEVRTKNIVQSSKKIRRQLT